MRWRNTRYTPTNLPQKYYTVKEWNRFNTDTKEVLLCKYDVILTNHQTKKEKAISILKKFNKKNLDRGIDRFNRGVDAFSESLKQIHFDPSGIDPIEGTWGKKKNLPDTTALVWGRKEKPRKKSRKGRQSSNHAPTTKELFWGKS